MTAKEYLLEIQKYRRLMKSLEEKAEALRTELAGLKAITYDKDRVQVSPSNKMEELIPRLVEIEEQYGRTLMKYHNEVLVRIQQIESIQPRECSEILRLRYIDGKKWEQIAEEMSYTERNLFYLHGRALRIFEKKYFIVFQYGSMVKGKLKKRKE